MSEGTPWLGARAYFTAAGDEEKCEWMRKREAGEVGGRNEEVRGRRGAKRRAERARLRDVVASFSGYYATSFC